MRKNRVCYLMKYQLLVILGIFLLVFSSCSSDFEDLRYLHNDELIEFAFITTESRAGLNSDGSGFFSEGDVIGLHINNGNKTEFRKLTYIGGKWTPGLRRSDFGEGELIISAHYPLVSPDNIITSFTIPSEQNLDDYNPADILFAKNILNAGEYKAEMKFNHIMHRLVIKSKDNLEKAEIKVRTVLNGEIDFSTGKVFTSVTDKSFGFINPKKNSNGTYEAIILPQLSDDYKTDEGLVYFTLNGKKTVYKAPEKDSNGKVITEFEAGKTFTINLSFVKPDFDWVNKKVWVYGITPPEDLAWKQFWPDFYSTLYLTWKKEYGWYDVNKRNAINNPDGIPDGMLCWAASATNLIHWWMGRNKVYIDKYIQLGKYNGPEYDYIYENALTEKKQESEIFQSFLDSFDNEAGYIDDGINWFIHGIKPSMPSMRYPINNAGYFKDVFPEGLKLSTNIAGMGKETFNKTIKDALLNNKAIGFNSGKVRNSHAMTIWGAEFDENGDVSYIYFVDNNDRDDFINNRYGCIRNKIVYYSMPEGGLMAGYNTGYLENGKPTEVYKEINRLYTLDLGTEYWEEYFNKIEGNK